MKNTKHFEYWPARLPKALPIPETTLYENLEISVRKYPDKAAFHYYGATYTYKEFLYEVESLAGYMENELQIKEKDAVLLFMQNSPQFLISFFAILRLRAVVVPINPMSTNKDLEFYVKDCQISHALVSQELVDKTIPLRQQGLLETMIIASYSDYSDEKDALQSLPAFITEPAREYLEGVLWKDAIHAGLTPSEYQGKSEDIAMIPYTSGTTGLPKGCVHTNRTVQANTIGAYHWMNLTAKTIPLVTLPLFHVTGLVHSALAPIYAGSTLVILTRWDREYAAQAIEKLKCTNWINISTMLIDFLANPKIDSYDISSLKSIGGGGAPLPAAVGENLFERTGLRYIEGYGLTETISHTHFNPPDRPKLQCLGVPSFGVDARVIDVATGEELGVGEEGELIVHGPQVFKGYYQREEENEESHIELEGKVFFKTGDIVKMDEEGYFFIVDRLKRMINASGFKVWPTEVESILYQHPAVEQAAVVSSPDEKRGETVKAFIILKEKDKGEVKEEEIIDWAKEEMAAYKYPRIVEFRDEFPTTSSGKILWRVLQEEA